MRQLVYVSWCVMMNTNRDACFQCEGEGSYVYDSGFDYSEKAGTHSYLAECEACNGTGYEPEEEDE